MQKTALVIGFGVSGKAAKALLESKGFQVCVYDDVPKEGMPLVDLHNIPWEDLELVVLSPGVPFSHFLCEKAKEKGISIIGEIELALRYLKQRAVAITGSNGKTTVTLLTTHVLNSSGISAKALGNVGEPLSSYVLNPDLEEVLVVELSSYQLESIVSAPFESGILLNITPDHLDRYPSMEAYAAAKCHLENCLKPGAFLTVHTSVAKEYGHLLKRPFKRYDQEMPFEVPACHQHRGVHDYLNMCAAFILTQLFGVTQEQFTKALQTFQFPRHRVEFVAEIEGVTFYDDSKGTNLDAVVQAVGTMKGPVLLIAGGVDKGGSYTLWKKPFTDKVKKIFVIGQAAAKIDGELGCDFEIQRCSSLEEAVEAAHGEARSGECVLLSPGCSSFDMFRDYVHRGEVFQACVCLKKGKI